MNFDSKISSDESRLIIAIDGYSSCGKSTLAMDVSKNLSLRYVDSGAMYRAVTLYFLQNDIALPLPHSYTPDQINELLDSIHIAFKPSHENGLLSIYLNDVPVEKQIRSMSVSEKVSAVSAVKEVRDRMVQLQKNIGKNGGVVMDGRDIGTVVFPHADLKIFMTAHPEVRAQRRLKELNESGINVTFDEVLKNLEVRDKMDTSRKVTPLTIAADALVLDNTNLNREEQLQFIIKEIEKLRFKV